MNRITRSASAEPNGSTLRRLVISALLVATGGCAGGPLDGSQAFSSQGPDAVEAAGSAEFFTRVHATAESVLDAQEETYSTLLGAGGDAQELRRRYHDALPNAARRIEHYTSALEALSVPDRPNNHNVYLPLIMNGGGGGGGTGPGGSGEGEPSSPTLPVDCDPDMLLYTTHFTRGHNGHYVHFPGEGENGHKEVCTPTIPQSRLDACAGEPERGCPLESVPEEYSHDGRSAWCERHPNGTQFRAVAYAGWAGNHPGLTGKRFASEWAELDGDLCPRVQVDISFRERHVTCVPPGLNYVSQCTFLESRAPELEPTAIETTQRSESLLPNVLHRARLALLGEDAGPYAPVNLLNQLACMDLMAERLEAYSASTVGGAGFDPELIEGLRSLHSIVAAELGSSTFRDNWPAGVAMPPGVDDFACGGLPSDYWVDDAAFRQELELPIWQNLSAPVRARLASLLGSLSTSGETVGDGLQGLANTAYGSIQAALLTELRDNPVLAHPVGNETVTCSAVGEAILETIEIWRGADERALWEYLIEEDYTPAQRDSWIDSAVERQLGYIACSRENLEDMASLWIPGRRARQIAQFQGLVSLSYEECSLEDDIAECDALFDDANPNSTYSQLLVQIERNRRLVRIGLGSVAVVGTVSGLGLFAGGYLGLTVGTLAVMENVALTSAAIITSAEVVGQMGRLQHAQDLVGYSPSRIVELNEEKEAFRAQLSAIVRDAVIEGGLETAFALLGAFRDTAPIDTSHLSPAQISDLCDGAGRAPDVCVFTQNAANANLFEWTGFIDELDEVDQKRVRANLELGIYNFELQDWVRVDGERVKIRDLYDSLDDGASWLTPLKEILARRTELVVVGATKHPSITLVGADGMLSRKFVDGRVQFSLVLRPEFPTPSDARIVLAHEAVHALDVPAAGQGFFLHPNTRNDLEALLSHRPEEFRDAVFHDFLNITLEVRAYSVEAKIEGRPLWTSIRDALEPGSRVLGSLDLEPSDLTWWRNFLATNEGAIRMNGVQLFDPGHADFFRYPLYTP